MSFDDLPTQRVGSMPWTKEAFNGIKLLDGDELKNYATENNLFQVFINSEQNAIYFYCAM